RYGPDELITSHQYQYNYVMYRGSSGQFIIFGCLYNAGLLTSGGKAWYCPSITDGGTAYDTPSNPWPPKSTNDPTQDTRMGYGSRPGWGWRTPTSTDNGYPTKRPRLSQMKNRAIFADIFSVKADIVRRHKDGLNVLYGNGAAKWVPYSVIQEEMELVQQITGGTFSPTVNTFFLDNRMVTQDELLLGKFDRY
ncbi:MAG TPA: hypothetical protein PKB10_15505, partial [Tepidisphaeraceae bacterium]|nr:hypothetical protein [Tepidisphaeraceae bacterium]